MSPLARASGATVLLAAGILLSQWVRSLMPHPYTSAGRIALDMMGIEIGLAVAAISIAWALPGRIRERLGLLPPRLPLHAVVALVIGTLGLSHTMEALIEWSHQLEGSSLNGIARGMADATSQPSAFWIGFFGTAIAPAFGEELLCRGLVQRGLARWIRPSLAIVAASLVFGWLHMELVHGTVAFCIGLYLGLAAHWSNSTAPAIAAHAANNFAALLGSSGLFVLRMSLPDALFGGAAVAALGLAWAWHARPPGNPMPPPASNGLQPGAESADA